MGRHQKQFIKVKTDKLYFIKIKNLSSAGNCDISISWNVTLKQKAMIYSQIIQNNLYGFQENYAE